MDDKFALLNQLIAKFYKFLHYINAHTVGERVVLLILCYATFFILCMLYVPYNLPFVSVILLTLELGITRRDPHSLLNMLLAHVNIATIFFINIVIGLFAGLSLISIGIFSFAGLIFLRRSSKFYEMLKKEHHQGLETPIIDCIDTKIS